MQKALELMNVKLTNVITDITGATGMQIIRAIVKGEHSPRELAKYRDFRCQKSEEEIAKSLNGHFKDEQFFVLNQALELYDYYTEKMKELDKKVEDQYIKFARKVDIKRKPLKKLLRSQECRDKNAPDYDLRSYLYKITGVDLTRVPGLNILNIQEIISEIGIDMSRWPVMNNFTSWLGVAPNNKITGGKKLSSHTKKTDNRANKAFRLAALSAGKTNTAIGRFHRKMKLKDGAPQAVTATAHKLARIVYVMISKQVEYSEEILERHEKMNKDKIIRNLKRKAANLGYNLVEKVA
jgi:transposase